MFKVLDDPSEDNLYMGMLFLSAFFKFSFSQPVAPNVFMEQMFNLFSSQIVFCFPPHYPKPYTVVRS